jgi:hypothetical protein
LPAARNILPLYELRVHLHNFSVVPHLLLLDNPLLAILHRSYLIATKSVSVEMGHTCTINIYPCKSLHVLEQHQFQHSSHDLEQL